jgi:hypothetical protein
MVSIGRAENRRPPIGKDQIRLSLGHLPILLVSNVVVVEMLGASNSANRTFVFARLDSFPAVVIRLDPYLLRIPEGEIELERERDQIAGNNRCFLRQLSAPKILSRGGNPNTG